MSNIYFRIVEANKTGGAQLCLTRIKDGGVVISEVHTSEKDQLWDLDSLVVIRVPHSVIPGSEGTCLTYNGHPHPKAGEGIKSESFPFYEHSEPPTKWFLANGFIHVEAAPDLVIGTSGLLPPRLELVKLGADGAKPLKFKFEPVCPPV